MATQPGNGHLERRAHFRVPARIEIHFQHAVDAARTLKAYSLNFSAGGLCIRTKKQYAVGEVLKLSLKVEREAFELRGAVAWVRGGAVGIRFEGISDEDRRRLLRVVEVLRA